MSSEQAKALLQKGIQAARTGDKDTARQLLQQSLRLDANNETAWLLLGSVARNNKEKLLCIQKALEINPQNETALKALQAMGIDPSRLTGASQPAPPPPPEPEPEPVYEEPEADFEEDFGSPFAEPEYEEGDFSQEDAFIDADTSPFMGSDDSAIFEEADTDFEVIEEDLSSPGVPLPSVQAVQRAEELAEQIIQGYLDTTYDDDNIEWVRKKRGRAGEREILLLRLQVAVALIVFLFAAGGLGIFAVSNSPEVQLVLFGATDTPPPPTSTPTNTPTNTPGFTPTPSPTIDFSDRPTFTASPTFSIVGLTPIPPNPQVTPVPTQLDLPEVPGRAVRVADEALNQGRPEEVLEDLTSAREGLGNTFNPNPFYYEALVNLRLGNNQAASEILNEAENRLDLTLGFVTEEQATLYRPWIDLGFAQYHLEQARDSLAVGNPVFANEQLAQAVDRAEANLVLAPDRVDGYLVLIEAALINDDFETALEVVERARERPELRTNLKLIVLEGQIELQRGLRLQAQGTEEAARESLERAKYLGEYAVFLNPFSQEAHQLQVETALALNDPGLAVIRSQGYLLYFPDNAAAFQRLGDARIAEGNSDLALLAYSSAVEAAGGRDVRADALIARAELYEMQRRYELATQDLTEAIDLRPDISTHLMRMNTAYAAGDYETVQEDIDALIGFGAGTPEVNLMQARLIIDQDGDAERALTLLNNASNLVRAELQPTADEYLARAHFGLGNLGDAINAINRSIAAEETGSRHFLRAQIHQARGERSDAIAEYQWVLTWDQVYDYDFADEAAQRIQDILDAIAEEQALATATAITATAEAINATATAAAPITETAQALATATVTAGVPLTQTAQAQATATTTAAVALTATADALADQTATAAAPITETAQANLTSTAFVLELTAAVDSTNEARTATMIALTEQSAEATPEAGADDSGTETPEPSATEESDG